jgi:hypothetical protein
MEVVSRTHLAYGSMLSVRETTSISRHPHVPGDG